MSSDRSSWVGPLFYYDVVRLARRGRSVLVRILYLLVLLVALWQVHERWTAQKRAARDQETTSVEPTLHINEFARFAEEFVCAILIVQNAAVFLLTPIYVASAIPEERERGTLDLLFTTHLRDREIILGKLCSRLVFLGGVLLAGLPVLALIQLWGGVDMDVILANFGLTAINLVGVGSLSICISTMTRSVVQAVVGSYFTVAAGLTCLTCMNWRPYSPFLLMPGSLEGTMGAEYVSMVRVLFWFSALILGGSLVCLVLASVGLRDPDGQGAAMPSRREPLLSPFRETVRPMPRRVAPPVDPFEPPPLPPVSDRPLLWKERYAAGPAWTRSPFVWIVIFMIYLPVFLGVIGWAMYARTDPTQLTPLREQFRPLALLMRVTTFAITGLGCLAAALRAAANIARERQRQTLDSLLILPCSRGEILRAKWLGAFLHGHGWLYALAALLCAEVWLADLHALSWVARLVLPLVHLVFLVTLGLCLSAFARTILQAYLTLGLVLVGLVLGPILLEFVLQFRADAPRELIRSFSPPYLWTAAVFARGEEPFASLGGFRRVLLPVYVYAASSAVLWLLTLWRWNNEGNE